MPQDPSNLIWIDLEMTGLDTQNDSIIEIATLVTDARLHIIEAGPIFAIHQSAEIMATMDEWNTRQHMVSGLTERVRQSRYSETQAELETLEFLEKRVPAGVSPMCGNSICQDRRFLARCMPKLEAYFHYRNLDVSTLKELANRWAPEVSKSFVKDPKHLAMEDIKDSINELLHYKDYLLRL